MSVKSEINFTFLFVWPYILIQEPRGVLLESHFLGEFKFTLKNYIHVGALFPFLVNSLVPIKDFLRHVVGETRK